MEAPCLSRIPPTGGRGARRRSRDDCDGLRARELSAVTVLVRAVGEIDASTRAAVGLRRRPCARVQATRAGSVPLTFFGTAGFSVLETINRQCARRSIDWVPVAGTEVARLLRVCDTDGALPVAGNIVSGVATLARGPHRQLQLTR
jgi:hypothetical protein